MQGICDSECRFTDVFAGWPGRSHDARVFSRSTIGNRVLNSTLVPGQNTLARTINGQAIEPFLIGDPAYPLCKQLLKDYSGVNLTQEQEYFNYRLNRARIQIERAFGILKGRWRCLLHPLECDLQNVVQHAIASCILHNICIDGNANYPQEWHDRYNDEIVDPPSLGPLSDDVGVEDCEQVRRVLVQYVAQN